MAAVAVARSRQKAADEERKKRQTRERADADEASTPRLSDAALAAHADAASHSLARLASALRAPPAHADEPELAALVHAEIIWLRRLLEQLAAHHAAAAGGGVTFAPPLAHARERLHATIAALATVLEAGGAEPGSGGSLGGRGLKREGSASGRDLERASRELDGERGAAGLRRTYSDTSLGADGDAASAHALLLLEPLPRDSARRVLAPLRIDAHRRSGTLGGEGVDEPALLTPTIFEGDETKVATSADETPAEAADRAAREAAVARIQRIQRGRLARKTMVFKKKYRQCEAGGTEESDAAEVIQRGHRVKAARKRLLQRRDRANTHRALLAAAATTADMDHAQFADARARHLEQADVTCWEWAQTFVPPRVSLSEKYVRESFERIDVDRSGSVTLDELRASLRRQGVGADEVASFAKRFDADGDNDVSFPEYYDAVMKCGLTTLSFRELSWRERAFVTLDDPASSGLARVLSIGILTLIVLSVASLVCESAFTRAPDGCALCASERGCKDENDEPSPECLAHCGRCEPEIRPIFKALEAIVIPIFTVEYLVSLLTVHDAECVDAETLIAEDAAEELGSPKPGGASGGAGGAAHDARLGAHGFFGVSSEFQTRVRRTWRYFSGPLQLCDLLAIAPFYLEILLKSAGPSKASSLKVLRLLRLARVTRIFKLGKQAEAFRLFVRVIQRSMPAMRVLLFFVFLLTILFGALIFAAEQGEWTVSHEFPHGAYTRPTPSGVGREVSPFGSIPEAFWFVLATTTTTGFGDVTPTTLVGKCLGVCAMICGILMLALPITVVGSNFATEYDLQQKLATQYGDGRKKRRRVTLGRAISSKMRRASRAVTGADGKPGLFGSSRSSVSGQRGSVVGFSVRKSQVYMAADGAGARTRVGPKEP